MDFTGIFLFLFIFRNLNWSMTPIDRNKETGCADILNTKFYV